MLKTFKSGVHPPENKSLTQNLSIEELPWPKTVTVFLSQHFGKPAKTIVKKGDPITEGDLIAEADGFISAPVHAPISGTIKQITQLPHVMGIPLDAIVIEASEESTPKIWERNARSMANLSLDEFISIIKEKGIVGLGGAGFPTFVKFMPRKETPLTHILINACECEPYINVDYRALIEQMDLFCEGIQLIQTVTKVPEIIIGIENNKPDAIQLLNNQFCDKPHVSIQALQTKYPQGGEKMLIKAALGKEVPRGGLPLDVGVVVINVNTVIAIAQAVFYDKPILEKIITVSGHGIQTPKNIKAKLGTSFSEIIEFCGGLKETTSRLVVGGPMMGFAQPDTQAAVLKSTTGLLALTEKEIHADAVQPCVRCGSCVNHCPMYLVPTELSKYVKHDRLDLAQQAGIMDCIECGCCVYSCHSHLPLVQLIKLGKAKLRQQTAKKG